MTSTAPQLSSVTRSVSLDPSANVSVPSVSSVAQDIRVAETSMVTSPVRRRRKAGILATRMRSGLVGGMDASARNRYNALALTAPFLGGEGWGG